MTEFNSILLDFIYNHSESFQYDRPLYDDHEHTLNLMQEFYSTYDLHNSTIIERNNKMAEKI